MQTQSHFVAAHTVQSGTKRVQVAKDVDIGKRLTSVEKFSWVPRKGLLQFIPLFSNDVSIIDIEWGAVGIGQIAEYFVIHKGRKGTLRTAA
jgi:hypothetical protein